MGYIINNIILNHTRLVSNLVGKNQKLQLKMGKMMVNHGPGGVLNNFETSPIQPLLERQVWRWSP